VKGCEFLRGPAGTGRSKGGAGEYGGRGRKGGKEEEEDQILQESTLDIQQR
jgi:hypothetical protein